MSRAPGRQFGDVGVETDAGGQRHVMYIAGESVVILQTTIPEDDDGTVYPGQVTYVIQNTRWGLRSDLEMAEMLDIWSEARKTSTELLR